MGKPWSNDLRRPVVAEIPGGSSIRAAARRFRVAVSTAVRRWNRWLQKGNADAPEMGGNRRSHGSKPHTGRIVGRVDEPPSLSLSEVRARLAEDGPLLAISTIRKIPVGEGNTRKKTTLHAGGQDRPDVQKLRKDWKVRQPALPVGKAVSIDECSVRTNMARSHGRSPRGKRCVASHPHGHRKTFTLFAGIRLDGIVVPLLLDGPPEGNSCIAPAGEMVGQLRPGDIVICDNLSVHRLAGVAGVFGKAGVTLLFLPPYSPDLNPIEMVFPKPRAYPGKVAAGDADELIVEIGRGLALITAGDARGYFRTDGYCNDAA